MEKLSIGPISFFGFFVCRPGGAGRPSTAIEPGLSFVFQHKDNPDASG
jgi:hypothetical protein